jgi:hypothetical protein
MSVSKNTILYHGNCIDGWMSAYIARSFLHTFSAVEMYPISPNQTYTWPNIDKMKGTNVILLDVSIEKKHRDEWLAGGVLSIQCIDHHETSTSHWPADSCPINTSSCTAVQVWRNCYAHLPEPAWLHSIDRIDRWDNPTYEDRCLREILNVIAHLPVQGKTEEAITMTDRFVTQVNDPVELAMMMVTGKQLLDTKDANLMAILNKGGIHTFSDEYIKGWNLPQSWLGAKVFIIDNTNITIDTTEAAHLVFQHHPEVNAFINYRKKILYGRGRDADVRNAYVYSARSRNLDLTVKGSILKGHHTSAGALLTVSNDTKNVPFVVSTV